MQGRAAHVDTAWTVCYVFTMEISEEAKAARDVINAILKTKKIVRMYPENNPIYVKTVEDCFGRYDNFFMYKDDLNIKIKQNEIFYDAEQVYHNPEKDDNLALFFFKDGLREVTFKKGMTQEEMADFLKIISSDFERDVIEDDIVTLLWERDFQNIQYVVDEGFLADEDDYESQAMSEVKEKETEPDNIMRAFEDAMKEEEEVKEADIVPLSDKDLQLLLQEIEKDSLDKTGKMVTILHEMFFLAENRNDISELVEFFKGAIDFALRRGDIALVLNTLSNLRKLSQEASLDEAVKKEVRRIMIFCGSEPVINLLGEILDSGQEIDEKLIEDYVRYLDSTSIMPFMKVLGELQSIHARKLVIDALIYLGPKDIVTLARGLNDSRWYVVRNIIYILRKIGDKRAVEYLLKTVRHGDMRVKKEVIRALGELGGANVIVALRDCLDDTDIQMRSSALKAIGNIGSEAAKRIIMDRIADKRFREKDFDEKKEYLEVLSRWKDSDVFNFLVKTIKKKSFFLTARDYEDKACAAYCFGLIGNKEALPVLNKFKNSGNKLLREMTFGAIKRIEHGQ